MDCSSRSTSLVSLSMVDFIKKPRFKSSKDTSICNLIKAHISFFFYLSPHSCIFRYLHLIRSFILNLSYSFIFIFYNHSMYIYFIPYIYICMYILCHYFNYFQLYIYIYISNNLSLNNLSLLKYANSYRIIEHK